MRDGVMTPKCRVLNAWHCQSMVGRHAAGAWCGFATGMDGGRERRQVGWVGAQRERKREGREEEGRKGRVG